MMKKTALLSCLTILSLLFATACSTITDEQDIAAYNANPLSVPVASDVPPSVLEQAMVDTFQGRNWTVDSSSPTQVVARLNHRDVKAQATMKRVGNEVLIYSDSEQLNPKTGKTEDVVPLGWLENLQKDLPRRLARLQR